MPHYAAEGGCPSSILGTWWPSQMGREGQSPSAASGGAPWSLCPLQRACCPAGPGDTSQLHLTLQEETWLGTGWETRETGVRPCSVSLAIAVSNSEVGWQCGGDQGKAAPG